MRAKKTVQLYVLSKESLAEVFADFPDVERIVKEPLEERKIARIKAEEETEASPPAKRAKHGAAGSSSTPTTLAPIASQRQPAEATTAARGRSR